MYVDIAKNSCTVASNDRIGIVMTAAPFRMVENCSYVHFRSLEKFIVVSHTCVVRNNVEQVVP